MTPNTSAEANATSARNTPHVAPPAGEGQRVEPETVPKIQVSRLADYELWATTTPLPSVEEGWIDVIPPQPRIPKYSLTQTGNAERLIARFGHKLRYCHTWAKWLLWNGQRWMPDTKAHIQTLAIQTVRFIPKEAGGIEDALVRTAVLNHAKRSEKGAELDAMVDLAKP